MSPACWIRVALCLDTTLLPSVVLHPVEWVPGRPFPPYLIPCRHWHASPPPPPPNYQLSVNPEDVDFWVDIFGPEERRVCFVT
jgi:hypothetical protein